MKRAICLSVMVAVGAGAMAASLPLSRVVLFSSGVGYFEHAGPVTNSTVAELMFRADQMKDVIKSLVVSDDGGGQIGAVTFDTRDPLERTLKSFRVDLTDNPDLPLLLNRMRGILVRVKTSGQDMDGVIVGVETQVQVRDDVRVERPVLNLLAGGSLRAVALEDVQNIEIADAAIAEDLQKALAVLAAGGTRDKKGLRLTFEGAGERPIRVAYIVETPLWRTSYRLSADAKGIFLQGWAHLENTTDLDWDLVQLSLVSGRPASFIQDLYKPFYLQRPVVETETHGAIVPPAYDAAKLARARKGGAKDVGLAMAAPLEASMLLEAEEMPAVAGRPVNLEGGGVAAMAAAGEAGDLFEYRIKAPVALPRQQAAMIPIVNEPVQGTRVSIYNASVNPRHPLNGIELENTSSNHLMGGPVTVFEDGVYAGDARLSDTRPAEKKLISYALDLACDVSADGEAQPEEIVSMRIARGTMFLQRRYLDETRYRLISRRAAEKELIVEHPIRPGWDLVEPREKPEKTAGLYRFRVALRADGEQSFTVREQRMGEQRVALANLDDSNIAIYLQQKVISVPVKVALKKLADLQAFLAALRQERGLLERRRDEITQDQARIRENMQTVAKNSENYARWERKLGEQEIEMDQIGGGLEKVNAQEQAQIAAIDEYLASLEVE
jgi:hypothetical protein